VIAVPRFFRYNFIYLLPHITYHGGVNMKIALLVVPFILPQYSGIGPTQIKGRLKEIFKENIEVQLLYLNHEFYQYFGEQLYQMISGGAVGSLMKEWVFRQEAFDRIKSNQEEYFSLFCPEIPVNSPEMTYVKEKLQGLGEFIRQLIAKYRLTSFDVIGVNATYEVLPALAFCRHLKQIKPAVITVLGGAALFKDISETLIRHNPHLDYVCCGSGLISFPALIRGIIENDETARNSIDGMLCRDNVGKAGWFSEELDINEEIPLDYDDFFESFHRFHPEQNMDSIILMETSRGCWWGECTFCGFYKEQLKYRVKRPGIAVEEINRYFKRYNSNIGVVDNIMPRSYIKKVLPYVQVPEGKFLMYETRSDYNEEEMKALNRAKVKMIQPGIESLSTPLLELMNKGTNAFQSIDMLKYCVKYGILAGWYLLVGFPGMTADMYERLIYIISRVFHLFPPSKLIPIRVDRFSIYWKNSEKYNIVLAPFPAYEYIYPYDRELMPKIAYHFVDRNYETERHVLLGVYYKKLEKLINNWTRRWQTKDIRQFPRLTSHQGEDGTYIYDSRQGSANQYKISPLEAEILNMLDTPHSADDLVTHFPGETGERITGVLKNLDDRSLIFKENGLYMNLLIRDYLEEEIKFLVETCNFQAE
jgi:ribosomal peptide maturation radical SAM protein 1